MMHRDMPGRINLEQWPTARQKHNTSHLDPIALPFSLSKTSHPPDLLGSFHQSRILHQVWLCKLRAKAYSSAKAQHHPFRPGRSSPNQEHHILSRIDRADTTILKKMPALPTFSAVPMNGPLFYLLPMMKPMIPVISALSFTISIKLVHVFNIEGLEKSCLSIMRELEQSEGRTASEDLKTEFGRECHKAAHIRSRRRRELADRVIVMQEFRRDFCHLRKSRGLEDDAFSRILVRQMQLCGYPARLYMCLSNAKYVTGNRSKVERRRADRIAS
ncbi:hypothetical protein BJ508DRAFT_378346 [Ascobolus immersus RN42]|uniref:Uncharacterized protein n=1 Tax=Ascobolus immersus RN42 TaxID=1160509 RepID=A0A3N4I2J8_ASCIM|nr:hypothetical protein BJ508DRAFT_378346 [Ascobolus immersus RN42]